MGAVDPYATVGATPPWNHRASRARPAAGLQVTVGTSIRVDGAAFVRRLEDLAGDMVVMLAAADPTAFLFRVLVRAETFVSECLYCRHYYDLKPTGGASLQQLLPVSHGCCTRASCVERMWQDAHVRRPTSVRQ